MQELKEKFIIPKRTKKEIETLALTLLGKMTLKEKIGQMSERTYDKGLVTGPQFDSFEISKALEEGMVGSILGVVDNKICYELQKKALKSRLGIPLLFCGDVIHGFKTAFPINLAMANSFDPSLITKVIRATSREASHSGLNLTFSPMVDLVRDPRWGRVMESNGEDSFLSGELAKAYVRGYQGRRISEEDSLISCVKHFVGYGACEGGRDYNSVNLGPLALNNYYLEPFRKAIKADVKMVMSAFNTVDLVPVTCNKNLLRKVLRKELGFKGVTISDYNSCAELLNHRVASDLSEVAKLSLEAGLDHEMVSRAYEDNLEALVSKDERYLKLIDEAVLRILELKYEVGLFDNPFKNIYEEENTNDQESNLKLALKIANESLVLLKNSSLLPLRKNCKISLIGYLADTKKINGAWSSKCDETLNETLKEAFKRHKVKFNYTKYHPKVDKNESLYQEALENSKDSDMIILVAGEDDYLSGEAHSRANLNLDKGYLSLIKDLKKLKKKLCLVVYAGRPLIIEEALKDVDAVIYAYYLGVQMSEALYETIFGINNPSGKLAMSIPKNQGQIPVYYNRLPTGRPLPLTKNDHYYSHYFDSSLEPSFVFGDGLSYSEFSYQNLKVIKHQDYLEVSALVKNESLKAGTEIVLVFINKLKSFISTPNYQLKGFKRVDLKALETKEVTVKIPKEELLGYNEDNRLVKEVTEYEIMIGGSLKKLVKEKITY